MKTAYLACLAVLSLLTGCASFTNNVETPWNKNKPSGVSISPRPCVEDCYEPPMTATDFTDENRPPMTIDLDAIDPMRPRVRKIVPPPTPQRVEDPKKREKEEQKEERKRSRSIDGETAIAMLSERRGFYLSTEIVDIFLSRAIFIDREALVCE